MVSRPASSTVAVCAALLLLPLSAAAPAAARPGGPGQAQSTQPRHQLLGDWHLDGGGSYTFRKRGTRVEGRSRRTLKLASCRIRRGTVLFRSYRFVRRSGGDDVWRGRIAFVSRDTCRRVFHSSKIVVHSDLRFTETASLDGKARKPGQFERIRPKVSARDRVVGTWVRNSVGVIVTAARDHYEGRAREAFLIGNGCTVPANTLVWRLEPVAPGRYEGTIATFQSRSAKCRPGNPAKTAWRFDAKGRLVRVGADGSSFSYEGG
jgi:hypothetical protein